MEQVILVDPGDKEIGFAEKLEAHKLGLLHRAFSIILFDQHGNMLLQKRASSKYHGGGLWSNSCCSHPKPDEDIIDAVKRRVKEELGIECTATFLFKVKYDFDMKNGLREHELDHVFVGKVWETPGPDPKEIDEIRWVTPDELNNWIDTDPESFTPWFRLINSKFNLTEIPA